MYQENVFTNHIYLIYLKKKDLALNNQQVWYVIKSNQTNIKKDILDFSIFIIR